MILSRASSPELAPLIADAYGLTERERAVTQLVAQGLPTSAMGRRLHISPWTVQDHLKSIFEKVGVSTRGELIARVFFEHYVPRLTRRRGQWARTAGSPSGTLALSRPRGGAPVRHCG